MNTEEFDSVRWTARLTSSGRDLAEELVKREAAQSPSGDISQSYHVVSTVEDFETIGSAVRDRLSEHGNITYSCLWTQHEILRLDPPIEISPVFRAFHDVEPAGRYVLVLAISDVGSVIPLRSMIVHMAREEGFSRFRSIEILSPTVFVDAPTRLKRELPGDLANLVSWCRFMPYPNLHVNGHWSELGGKTPSALIGMEDVVDREYFTPPDLQRRIDERPRRPRPPKDPSPTSRNPVF